MTPRTRPSRALMAAGTLCALLGCESRRGDIPGASWMGTAITARPPNYTRPDAAGPRPLPPPRRPTRDPAPEAPSLGRDSATAQAEEQVYDPKDVESVLRRVHALEKAGKLPAALAMARRAVIWHPDEPRVHLESGRLAAASGSFGASRMAYERALSMQPESDAARYGLALAQLRSDAAAQAIRTLGPLAERRPDDKRVRRLMAEARDRAGDAAGAARAWEEAGTPGAAALGGAALGRAGKFKQAAAALREAAAESPDDPTIQLQLGTSLALQGELAPAEVALRAAARLAPEQAKAWRNLAAVRERLGDTKGAAEAYEALLLNVPGAADDGLVRRRIQRLRDKGVAAPAKPAVK